MTQGNYSPDTGLGAINYKMNEADLSEAEKIYHKLCEPFPADQIEWRIAQSGVKNGDPWAKVLAYVDNRAIMDRLDEVLGNNNWQEEYRELMVGDGGFICRLGIRIGGEWIWKEDGANLTNFEAIKGGLSGAMKRVAVKFGIGRYLYGLDTGWANFTTKKNGRYRDKIDGEWHSWNPPDLPTWALPSEKHEFLDKDEDIQLGATKDWIPDDVFADVLRLIRNGNVEQAKKISVHYKFSKDKQNRYKKALKQAKDEAVST